MGIQEKPASLLPSMFPSKRQRYLRVPPEYAYECIVQILRRNLKLSDAEIKHLGNLTLRASLGGKIGVNLKVHIAPEGDISVLNFIFSYRKMAFLAFSLIAVMVILSLLFNTPALMMGLFVLVPIAYHANFEVTKFLNALNEGLPLIEREYAHETLLKNRERWRKHLKDVQKLYEKLCKKHVETWGNTNILKYKIEEYKSIGLTYEEAIIKISEEEGIIVK